MIKELLQRLEEEFPTQSSKHKIILSDLSEDWDFETEGKAELIVVVYVDKERRHFIIEEEELNDPEFLVNQICEAIRGDT